MLFCFIFVLFMSLSGDIAYRIAFGTKSSFSTTIIKISILAVTLSVAAMIIGIGFIKGFQNGVKDKFYKSWGQIHITPFLADPTHMNQEESFVKNDILENKLKQREDILAIHSFSLQSVILKSKTEIEGLALKAYSDSTSFNQIKSSLKSGRIPYFADSGYAQEFLLSEFTAKKLQVNQGDKLLLYFLLKDELTPRVRRLTISGIYATGLEEYDKAIALCDQRLIDNIRKDTISHIQAYEIYLKDVEQSEALTDTIYQNYLEAPLYAYSVKERFYNVFTWLDMLSMNERILVGIMLIVAIMNMVSTLLILILERTQMIGILKSLGMHSKNIMQIFLRSAFYVLGLGLLFGNTFGIGIILLQKHFGFIRLNPQVYYVKTAPVDFHWPSIFFINGLVLLVMLLTLLIPALTIRRVQPIKALKFD